MKETVQVEQILAQRLMQQEAKVRQKYDEVINSFLFVYSFYLLNSASLLELIIKLIIFVIDGSTGATTRK